jgi:hypothetical protein
MARKVLKDTAYTFTPSTRTLVIPRYIPRERLVLITNVTANKVIYNFSDASLLATSYTPAYDSSMNETTTIVFNYNTTAMAATDKIQVTIDEWEERFTPAETQTDPTNKLRVTTPQALIDTDFEYGTQISKWENLTMINNRPFASQSPAVIPYITDLNIPSSSRTVTITTSQAHGLNVGTPIAVQDGYFPFVNGNFIIETVPTSTTFTYTARTTNTTTVTSMWDPNKTAVYSGTLYSNAQIGAAPTSVTYSGNIVTVITSVPHGLSLGNEIAIVGLTASTNAPNGSYVVAGIPNNATFTYYTPNTPTGTITFSSAAVYVRPQGQFLHRAFDGGVLFSSNGSSNFEQAVRQTRRYFRYQSGKGIQMSSGTTLKPYAGIDSLTSSGTTVTVQTKERHNIQPGTIVTITGANESAYNGTFTVTNVLAYNQFTYTAATVPSSPVASGIFNASVSNWYGATNRLGIFDQQNGLFWQYDGQNIAVVRRNSTTQVAGRVTVTQGSNTITQTNASYPTYFSKQLAPGDFIVLRGQSYRVTEIASDTSMTISPSYRGASSSFVVISKTVDTVIPQSQFNIDKIDGTGPSGYNANFNTMQMFYVDFTWYGAGFVRWGIRGPKGDIIYVHRMPNNNLNPMAYMRSGNLPGRYETFTNPIATTLTQSVGTSDTTINVASTTGFNPAGGTICIRNASQFEFVNYTGLTSTSFTGVTRAQTGNLSIALTVAAGSNIATVSSASGLQVGQRVFATGVPDGTFITAINGTTVTLSQGVTTANPTATIPPMAGTAQAFTYAATAPIMVESAYPTFAPSLSHWGTSVIMDGRFDDDRSLLFTYGQTTQTSLGGTSSTVTTVSGTSGTNTITVGSNTNLVTGMSVTGTGIATGAIVTAINGNTLTLSINNSGSVSGNGTFTGATQKALFTIRIAPSVDNGTPAAFGARELINRMQLVLRALDITLSNTNNVLVTAVLNGVPTVSVAYTNAVGNAPGRANSSLANIADYASGYANVIGGETTGGFFTNATTSLDLSLVRDLGNSILGGGGANSNTNIYPDGPDNLTIVVQNLSATPVNVAGRLSWTEAQA